MNLSLKKVAGALSFAHLAGLGRGKAAASAEDGDEKKDRDHEDGDVKKAKKADADEPKDDDKKKDGDARAEDDDPDANAAADDPVEEDKDDGDEEKKGKKAKAKADDGDDDDDKMKAGAKKERARCAAIFASPAAAGNVAMAAELAFNTDLSASQAIAVLGKAPAARAGHPNRAAANPRIGAGGSPEVTGKQAIDSRWDRAFATVSPQKRK